MAKKCTGCGRLDTEPLGLNKNGEPFLSCCPDNNYKEITALEWLEAKVDRMIQNGGDTDLLAVIEHVQQAKEMEKEQIMKAVYDAMGTNFDPNMGRAELYYNNTFKTN